MIGELFQKEKLIEFTFFKNKNFPIFSLAEIAQFVPKKSLKCREVWEKF
jgi:hypothetical protein